MKYRFWGWEHADTKAITAEYKGIETPVDLYDALSHVWCADTCAPRMRQNWTKENMTLGQCSITAFLAQDIFGGKVYGILRPGGNYHCYNVIRNCKFVSAKYCYAAHESRLHQNDRCKRFALCLVLTVRFRSLAPWGKLFQLFI